MRSNLRESKRPLRLFATTLVIGFLFHAAYADRKERSIESWQPTHFDISISLNDTLSELTSAKADITVLIRKKDTEVVDLDFGNMPVSAVTVDGATAKFTQHDEKLDVFLPHAARLLQRVVISVTYAGTPKDGLILVKDKEGIPSAIGDNWPDRVHNWIPCLDHPSAKSSVRFTVTAPSRNAVVANGKLESRKDNSNATTTWVWNETHNVSPYNMVIAAGQFATGDLKAGLPLPISYYVTHTDGQFADRGFSSASDSVQLFSRLVGSYPYDKLALIVGATRFGGMENANTIVFTPGLFRNFDSASPRSDRYKIPSGVESVVAHEIAHQWFGDAVTESTWADLWLSEGFATYFAGLFIEANEGKDAFRAYMSKNSESYFQFEKKNRRPLHDVQTEKLMDLLNPNNYEKGSWVLHGLRGMLGDAAFFRGLKRYYEANNGKTATSETLRASLEAASGKNLQNFFDRWVYQSGHPVYSISWTAAGRGIIDVKLVQSQPDEAFLMPVTIEIITKTGTKRLSVTPRSKELKLRIRSADPTKIVVDPDDFILKEVVAQ